MSADTRAAEAALDDLAAAVRAGTDQRPLRPSADAVRRGRRIRRRHQGGRAFAVATVIVAASAGAWQLRTYDEPRTGIQVGASTPGVVATAAPTTPLSTSPPSTAVPTTPGPTPAVPTTAATPATPTPPMGTPPAGERFIAPVAVPMGDGFGYLAGRGRVHSGVDYIAEVGTPVVAARSGRVVPADPGESTAMYGKFVIIDHGDGLRTYYAHLSEVRVSPGQTVSQGQQIGAVGATGQVTGPALHFEIHRDGIAVNPAGYLNP